MATLFSASLQYRHVIGTGAHFVLGLHLGFGNFGGLEQGKICRGSKREVEKWATGEGEGKEKYPCLQALFVCRTRTPDGWGLCLVW